METAAAPPLTQQVAGLAAGCRCESGRLAAQAGVVAALHALIFAALAGLLGRLESLMALLAAGQLPSHTACQTSERHPAVPVPASPLRAAAPYLLESPAPQHLFPTATPLAARVTAHPAKIAPVVVRSRLCPNLGRAASSPPPHQRAPRPAAWATQTKFFKQPIPPPASARRYRYNIDLFRTIKYVPLWKKVQGLGPMCARIGVI